eukprot:12590782-Heterocapsa_arctica.AAC.1
MVLNVNATMASLYFFVGWRCEVCPPVLPEGKQVRAVHGNEILEQSQQCPEAGYPEGNGLSWRCW